MDWKTQKVLVAGSGKSGIGATDLLKKVGAEVIIYDGNDKLKEEDVLNKLENKEDVKVILGELEDSVINEIDMMVLSPGIAIDAPFVLRVKEAGVPIWGEIELAYVIGKGKLAAITGTNGKTTTTALVGEIMANYYDKVDVVGNIGNPYTTTAFDSTDDTVTVAEISSFQLETIHTFKPDVSAVLNITPDHLNRHYTMECYTDVKMSIAKNQDSNQPIVLNYEDPILREYAGKLTNRIIWFSSKQKVNPGVYLEGKNIIYADGKKETFVTTTEDTTLVGIHNVENIMAAIIGSPTRYIQGKGEMKNLCSYADKFGKNLFILTSASGRKRVEPAIDEGNKDSNLVYDVFNGECCMTEINRIIKIVEEAGSDVIIGIGGGKIHDTSKAVAYYTKKPVIIVPTIASTDAPCSALSVIYTDEGVFEKYLFLPSSPDMVMVDTDIVCKAPVRLLISGMGDALATYFEARACKRSDASNCVGGKCTLAAMNLAQLCYDTLMENGVQAMIAAKEGICTKAVENVIEANTYLSGIGFESGGLAGAHAIHNGFTAIPETHKMYHGEKVAFGTLVQLVLEDAGEDEIMEVIDFCSEIGLPVTLKGLGIEEVKPEQIMEVARLACAPDDTMGNMPFDVEPEDL